MAMKVRQTQLMLIIDNMNVPLSSKATVYQDVMDAWTKSMIMLDKLISGVPQSVESGEALLGLCAWHIYPDICALGKTSTMVEQQDTLVKKGGLVTIGLHSARREPEPGISWSMPLAHLRYYGKAVISQGAVGSQKLRVTFDRIIQVAMGSMLSTWGSEYTDLEEVAQFMIAFGQMLRSQNQAAAQSEWPTLILEQWEHYINSNDKGKSEMARYIALGQRRYGKFLGDAGRHSPPCFGLSDPSFFLQFQDSEQSIASLRSVAQKIGDLSLDGAIIRCFHPTQTGGRMIEYASLLPQSIPNVEQKKHRRWLVLPVLRQQGSPISAQDKEELRRAKEVYLRQERAIIKRSLTIIELLGEPCGFLDEETIIVKPPFFGLDASGFTWADIPAPRSLDYLLKCSSKPGTKDDNDVEAARRRCAGWQVGHLHHDYKHVKYHFLLGRASSVAVFRPVPSHQGTASSLKMPIDFVTQSIRSGHIDAAKFSKYFGSKKSHYEIQHGHDIDPYTANPSLQFGHVDAPMVTQDPDGCVPTTGSYFESLIALARAYEVYVNLPSAEVDLNVISSPLYSSQWATTALLHKHPVMTRESSLACVTMFDTGYLDLDLGVFREVIAISSANTIYASEILFCDPSHLSIHALRHVTGNIGKPGLALLLSPRDTILREPDLETWELVNHVAFDGKSENNFAATSLHLSLTGYEQALNLGRHGNRDKEAFYVEAVVSVHDHGSWMADVDLLHLAHNVLRQQDMCSRLVILPTTCEHEPSNKNDTSFIAKLTSIDNWYEFIDRPGNAAVVRAFGNWVARLALAAIPRADDETLLVVSKNICWACVRSRLERWQDRNPDRLFILH
ncbi:MAG: hypothetical protein Q9225_003291 [Loekoesia sp. 1 TL-2023]